MRKTMSFKIEGYDKQFEVRELTIREIIDLMQQDELLGKAEEEKGETDVVVKDKTVDPLGLAGFKQVFENKFLPIASNIEMDDLIALAPSELEIVLGNFEDVNSSFFALARRAGLDVVLLEIRKAITADFGNLLANL